jgi:uncharacterized protein (DUF488 family)
VPPLLTFGHGRLSSAELAALLRGTGVERVVDVRRFPGSRTNEAAAKGAVPALLEEIGIDSRWDERLGGRRQLSAADDERSPDSWWQVKAFRAYAAWTRSDDFRAGMAELLGEVREQRTAVMCSEAVWWRCHRRIIADVAVLAHDVPVEHLMHTGKLTAHRPSDGARTAGHEVVWDG